MNATTSNNLGHGLVYDRGCSPGWNNFHYHGGFDNNSSNQKNAYYQQQLENGEEKSEKEKGGQAFKV